MVWLGACSEGVTLLVIFEEGTLNHAQYIEEVLPVALDYGNSVVRDNWTFQQVGAKPHTHRLSQNWCKDHFPAFFDQQQWPANSPNLNTLDYCIWDELAHAINWDQVATKQTLIVELRRAVKKIRPDIVYESCHSWTMSLHRVATNDGNHVD